MTDQREKNKTYIYIRTHASRYLRESEYERRDDDDVISCRIEEEMTSHPGKRKEKKFEGDACNSRPSTRKMCVRTHQTRTKEKNQIKKNKK
jgi:hypothetical protein